ncbi:hypothetical protein PanWU01x14_243670 [Parasponia andersonii]|uniref:Uncharacterized protein n=1 Tax=Parasponia andersonii TaxID=3476 RepID=A0A2P5BFF2_PARAD|nr:hypothetical protein PanWU01x14_243670 [Parasponia andersonii]
MSQSNNSSQKSTQELEKFKSTIGWEIVPYVPRIGQECDLSEEQISVAELKAMFPDDTAMNDTVIEAAPVAYRLPYDYDPRNTIRLDVQSGEQSQKTKLRTATILAGEVSFSFELPNDFPFNGSDIDKLLRTGEKGRTTAQNERKFLFPERLRGWKVERRQRVNKRYDLYYRHEESGAHLRSVIEVVNFLLYEDNPYKRKTQYKTTLVNENVDNSHKKKTQNRTNLAEGSNECQKKPKRTFKKKSTCPNSQTSGSKSKDRVAPSHVPYNVSEQEIITNKKIMMNRYLDDAQKMNILTSANIMSKTSLQFMTAQTGKQDAPRVIEENSCTDNSSEATVDESPNLNLLNSSKKYVPKENKRMKVEEPNDEEDDKTDTEATCSDPLLSATNYFMGDKNAEASSTCTSALAKATYKEINKKVEGIIDINIAYNDEINSAPNEEVDRVLNDSNMPVEELNSIAVEAVCTISPCEVSHKNADDQEEVKVLNISCNPVEEMKSMQVEASGTQPPCDVAKANKDDHKEMKAISISNRSMEEVIYLLKAESGSTSSIPCKVAETNINDHGDVKAVNITNKPVEELDPMVVEAASSSPPFEVAENNMDGHREVKVVYISNKPVEELNGMEVESGSTPFEVADLANIDDHGEVKVINIINKYVEEHTPMQVEPGGSSLPCEIAKNSTDGQGEVKVVNSKPVEELRSMEVDARNDSSPHGVSETEIVIDINNKPEEELIPMEVEVGNDSSPHGLSETDIIIDINKRTEEELNPTEVEVGNDSSPHGVSETDMVIDINNKPGEGLNPMEVEAGNDSSPHGVSETDIIVNIINKPGNDSFFNEVSETDVIVNIINKPVIELNPMQVEADSTNIPCDFSETNIDDHGEELNLLKVDTDSSISTPWEVAENIHDHHKDVNVIDISNKPMEELNAGKVEAGSTSTPSDAAKINIDDHGEVKDEAVQVKPPKNANGDLVVLSSFSDECDLINHIPLGDDDLFGTP